MKITLPYPISTNRYWRHSARGVFISPEARAYRAEVRLICMQKHIVKLAGFVDVECWIVPKSARCIDVDNSLKIALDALQGWAYYNDKQIVSVKSHKCKPDKDNPRFVVKIDRGLLAECPDEK